MQQALFFQFLAESPIKISDMLKCYGFVCTKTFYRHYLFQAGNVCIIISKPETATEIEFVAKHPCLSVYGIGLAAASLKVSEDSLNQFSITQSCYDFAGFKARCFSSITADINYYMLDADSQAKFYAIIKTKPLAEINYLGLDHFAIALPEGQFKRAHDIFTQLFGLDVIYNLNIDAGSSGMRSLAMANENRSLRFPLVAPNGVDSQVQEFLEQNNGAGVQHVGLQVENIFDACEFLQKQQVCFVVPPDRYYATYNTKQLNFSKEQLYALQRYGILFDVIDSKHYLLQVFCLAHNSGGDGPFFFEIIQRCGHDTFTEKNIRALFDSFASTANM